MSPHRKHNLSTAHPAPYRSPLWQEFGVIYEMVHKRRPWREIAEVVGPRMGYRIPTPTLFNFYRRYLARTTPLPRDLVDKIPAPPNLKRSKKHSENSHPKKDAQSRYRPSELKGEPPITLEVV